MSQQKLTAKDKRLLEWLGKVPDGMLLESQVIGSGLDRSLNNLLMTGLVDMVPHPTVKDRSSGAPATAVVLLKKS